MALLLQACGPLRQVQKVESQVPIIGSVGKYQSTLFKKGFQKIGKPRLSQAIAVTFRSMPLLNRTKARYVKYRDAMGLPPLESVMDSSQIAHLKYFQFEISDMVQLVNQLNQENNTDLKTYLQGDTKLVLLSSMSFVATEELALKLEKIEKVYLMSDTTGTLTLYMGGDINDGYAIDPSAMDIFDFQMATFCWKKDKRGHLQIAQILMEGGGCPGNTKADPEKLNKTPDYLKL